MKAIVYSRYGLADVLEFREVDNPAVMDGEVLVRIHAASVNPAEWFAMTGLFIARPQLGFLKPRNSRLGVDFAGVVEAVGNGVTDLKPGDEVFGGQPGAFAEEICVRDSVAPKPANLSFEQAAAVPTAAVTALQGLRDHGRIKPGQHVLINGASGGVGTFAVQIAKALGAEVTGVCSTKNVGLVRSLGADHVIDYTQDDFTRKGRRYDLVLDIAGSRSWPEYRRVLHPNGTLVIVGGPKTNRWIGPLSHVLKVRLSSLLASQKVVFFVANFNREDFAALHDLLASGKVTPVIDRTYPLSETAEAMRYLGSGRAAGKVVITVKHRRET